jgi:hypothetical protein
MHSTAEKKTYNFNKVINIAVVIDTICLRSPEEMHPPYGSLDPAQIFLLSSGLHIKMLC